jgi:hypothetical protein
LISSLFLAIRFSINFSFFNPSVMVISAIAFLLLILDS